MKPTPLRTKPRRYDGVQSRGGYVPMGRPAMVDAFQEEPWHDRRV